ncbi:MAG: efflux RND transporter periplasmic adaptor subunit [Polyangiaceae bacterium]|nr:efflux RND transporter periplasmic adaptor subunit [Polyangiaceae bacterium]
MRPGLAGVLAALVAASACRSKPDAGEGETRSARGAAAPVEGAMCKEHGVLEAVCTKCNPKLVPVFQAKADWCTEHAFPESFCPICHPERGGKPKAEVARDAAPADGTKIRFKRKDVAKLAGIETVKASPRPNAPAITAPAKLVYDATKQAQVNARSPGVVRTLKVDVGARVKNRQALVVIDSPDVGADRARLAGAKSRVKLAEENLTRQKQLLSEGIAAQKSVSSAQQELDLAKSEHAALAASLSSLGAGGGGGGSYTLSAPLAGVVTERKVTLGKLVSAGEVLLEIVDTSSMWADVEVLENDLSGVAVGQGVTLTFDGLGDREIAATIGHVAPAVDPHTRTARVRVSLPNPDGSLRANMYGRARIAAGESRTGVAVPLAALQRVKGVTLVFVRVADAEYETRRVQTGASDAEYVEIVKGVRAGEEVVTTGAFLLKTETLKDSIGAGCCEVD